MPAAFAALVWTACGTGPSQPAGSCVQPAATWIWCDDFEQDRLASYFEVATSNGSFARVAGVGRGGSFGMRAHWTAGQVDAGALHLAFGQTPQTYFRPVDAGTTVYRDVYWRVWLWRAPGWTGGGGDKLSRAISFASATSWAQAVVAHVWSGGLNSSDRLVIDPASGTDAAGVLQTTTYNDFAHFRWLGAATGTTPVFADSTAGRWYCVEAHARLETPGASDGVFELWVDGQAEAQRTGMEWVGGSAAYGINAVFLENYWNAGAPGPRERVLDDFVVATTRIGC